MVFNRRRMLQASLGVIALSVSGCTNTKTTIIFINNLPVALSVNASANGISFKKNNIQPGHQASQVYHTSDTAGTVVSVTGSATPKGGFTIDLATLFLTVTLGFQNAITVGIDPISGLPVADNVVS